MCYRSHGRKVWRPLTSLSIIVECTPTPKTSISILLPHHHNFLLMSGLCTTDGFLSLSGSLL